jgi:hypothetical protein
MTGAADTQPPEEPKVESHKSKRWLHWRSYLKEYAIIVVGVATALAAQQAADWLRWESEVKTARAAIRAEMASTNLNLYAFRVAIAPCLERKWDEAQAAIAALETGRKAKPLAGFRTGLRSVLSDSEWQTARASQVLTHFPRSEMVLMSSYYSAMQNQSEYLMAEGMAWSELSILQDAPAGISTSDIIRLRVNLDIARRMALFIERNSRRQLEVSERLGLAPTKLDPARVTSAQIFCSNMSLEEWRRWQNTPEAPRPMPAVP